MRANELAKYETSKEMRNVRGSVAFQSKNNSKIIQLNPRRCRVAVASARLKLVPQQGLSRPADYPECSRSYQV